MNAWRPREPGDARHLVPSPAPPHPGEPLPPSDAELLAAARLGQDETADRLDKAAGDSAYATLYRRHVSAARNLARQFVRGRPEAEDIVAEAFARVLGQLRRGGGPDGAFRPYLLTTVRRVAIDRLRAEGKLVVSDQMEAYDPGVPFADPAVADLERTMIVRAFASLPERWRTVLWHTEVEGARPAEVAASLGLTANGVAALAYRAREGLRQAYLQMHLSGAARGDCRPVVTRLGAYVRDGLAKRETAAVAAHLTDCAECRAVYLELSDVNVTLRGIVAPVILGPATAAYLASASHGGVLAWLGGRLIWFRHAPKSQQAATAGATAATVAGLVALALALTANTTPAVRTAPPARARVAPASPPRVVTPLPRRPPAVVPRHSSPAAPVPSPVPPRPSPHPTPPSPPPHRRPPKPRQVIAPTSPAPVRLSALINPVGALVRGGSGIVQFTVANPSRRASGPITAAITLPSGVSYADPPLAGGWTCVTSRAGASCTHAALAPGAGATGYLPVTVGTGAAVGAPPSIAVTGGTGAAVTARASVGVAASGLSARFAATGQDTVVTAGAALGCGHDRGWPHWDRGAAALTLPGQVLWAGLYWAGYTPGLDQGYGVPVIAVRGPGGDYQQVTADEAGDLTGPYGRPAFVAFADVTGLVARYGAGVWSALPMDRQYGHPGEDFGWTLVVVAADPEAPPGTQVMVLDGAHEIDADNPDLPVPLDALPPGRQANIRTVTWSLGSQQIDAFPQDLAENPVVDFTSGNTPYLVGVVTVTDPAHQ